MESNNPNRSINDICTDVVLADATVSCTYFPRSHNIDRIYRVTGAKEILSVLCIPKSQHQPHTPFTSCFAALAFAVFFTERLHGHDAMEGGNGIDSGISVRFRDMQEQMSLCVSVMKEQAHIFPVAMSGVEKAVEIMKASR
jgi:hypothetical protein